MRRGLEIGPGASPLPSTDRIEWDTMEAIDEAKDVFAIHMPIPMKFHGIRWGEDRIPQGDRMYDQVYASHVIEHVDWRRVDYALREVRRVLKPRGLFEVWTMDVRELVDAYLRGECGDKWRRGNPSGDPFVWFVARLHAYGPPDGTPENWHRGQFDGPYMRRCLERAGFVEIETISRRRGVSHGPCEFGMTARRS